MSLLEPFREELKDILEKALISNGVRSCNHTFEFIRDGGHWFKNYLTSVSHF